VKHLKKIITLIILCITIIWSMKGLNLGLDSLPNNFKYFIEFVGNLFPPDLSIVPKLIKPILQTFQIAIIATFIAIIAMIPLAFLAAKNINHNKYLCQFFKTLLGVLRGIPPLLYALLFVSFLGLGPLAGILAIAFHVVGALGRFYSESIEAMDMNPIQAMKMDGANKLQLFYYGIIYGTMEHLIGYSLYFFEYAIRTSTILGLVGAGGIGVILIENIHLFKYQRTFTILLIIIGIIIVVDKISSYYRHKLIKDKY